MYGILFPIVLTIHILVGISVIGLVLIQHGKGADMGAAFGSGASGSLFGASGSANFLSRTTAALAAVFFMTSLGLAYMANSRPEAPKSVIDTVETQPAPGNVPAPSPAASSPAAESKEKDIPK